MTNAVAAGEPFRIGACLARALSLYRANFVTFTAAGLLVMVPGFMLLLMTFGNMIGTVIVELRVAARPMDVGVTAVAGLLAAFVFVLTLQYLLTAVITYAALRSLRGDSVPAAAALGQGLHRLLPIIGVAAATVVLVAAGLVLLVVPGLVVALLVSLAVPVLMIEGTGAVASLSRSRELTRGLRWQLAGFFLVAIVACLAVNAAISLSFDLLLPQEGPMLLVVAIVEAAVQLFTTVFLAVLPVAAYHDLRTAKEGVSSAQLVAELD